MKIDRKDKLVMLTLLDLDGVKRPQMIRRTQFTKWISHWIVFSIKPLATRATEAVHHRMH